MTSGAGRIELLDTLRGFALLGIIQINLPSFVAGLLTSDVLLQFNRGPADWAAWIIQTVLIQGKFYPIFAFLLGYGFEIQSARLSRRGIEARAVLLRRYAALLVLGMAHGMLLYFGDILTMYALAGLAMILQGPASRAGLRWRIGYWLAASLLVNLAARIPGSGAAALAPGSGDALAAAIATLAGGPFLAGAEERAQWYLGMQFVDVLLFLPQILFFMSLGAYGARVGWLRHPGLHRPLWRRAAWLGLTLGLPVNLAYAACAWQIWKSGGKDVRLSEFYDVLGQFVALLSCLYVAALVALARGAGTASPVGRIMRGLAGYGRLALTNYVMQSVLMVGLLTSLGLGLAREAHFALLLAWGVGIVLVQLALSHVYLRYRSMGPLEWLWRRISYAGLTKLARRVLP
jgi:uncharacterized protein